MNGPAGLSGPAAGGRVWRPSQMPPNNSAPNFYAPSVNPAPAAASAAASASSSVGSFVCVIVICVVVLGAVCASVAVGIHFGTCNVL